MDKIRGLCHKTHYRASITTQHSNKLTPTLSMTVNVPFLYQVSLMLNVANKSFNLRVVMLNVIMPVLFCWMLLCLSVVMWYVIMLNVVCLLHIRMSIVHKDSYYMLAYTLHVSMYISSTHSHCILTCILHVSMHYSCKHAYCMWVCIIHVSMHTACKHAYCM